MKKFVDEIDEKTIMITETNGKRAATFQLKSNLDTGFLFIHFAGAAK